QEYSRLVFHTIYGLTGDWEESQDLTQDTFHQAFKGLAAAQAVSGERFHAKAWLLRIALNTVRMQRRRRNIFSFIPFSHMHEGKQQDPEGKRQQEAEIKALPVQPAGYGAVEQDDPAELIAEQDAVQRTLVRLPENLRLCLLLSIIGGLSTAEIAATLHLNEAAVRQRLARARKQFQRLYAYENGEELVEPVHSPLQSRQEERETPDQPLSAQQLRLTTQPPAIRSSYA
ncbi:MAG: RNA polymerase sigma factor, partial [Ktedonobacteraceae bacterium]|nr:RNA polymerase sigma factor [Ktedonobacteraceae bacterium]